MGREYIPTISDISKMADKELELLEDYIKVEKRIRESKQEESEEDYHGYFKFGK